MNTFIQSETLDELESRKQALFGQHFQEQTNKTNKIFCLILLCEWLTGIVIAIIKVNQSSAGELVNYIPLLAATLLGFVIISLPVYLTFCKPEESLSKYIVSMAQMIYGVLFFYLSGSHFETQFYIFVSLAALALYREWRVIALACFVSLLNHFTYEIFSRQVSSRPSPSANPFLFEYIFWIGLESLFLIITVRQSNKEMQNATSRYAELEVLNQNIEEIVSQKSQEIENTQEQVQTNETRLHSALENSDLALWEWDIAKNIIYYDEAWATNLGCDLSTFGLSRSILDRPIHRDDKLKVEEAIKAHLNKVAPSYEVEYRIQQKYGEWIWVLEKGRISKFSSHGEPLRITGTTQNLSKRKHAEEELKRLMKEAKESSKLKSEFLTDISHEIRTPLNSIFGMTSLLSSSDLDEKQAECLYTIQNCSNELLNIIENILDFSTHEGKRLPVKKLPFDLSKAINEIVDLFMVEVQRKSIELSIDFSPDLSSHLVGDEFKVRQIMLNLLANAIKFTNEGEIKIKVEGFLGESPQDSEKDYYVKISIIDTGIGISEEKLNNLLQPENKEQSLESHQQGLGLNICKKLVGLMGGKLGIESREKEGSIFWFSLKLELAEPSMEEQFKRKDLEDLKILIAIGNNLSSHQIIRIFNSWKYSFETAQSNDETIKMLSDAKNNGSPYDILILGDSTEIETVDLASQIKQNPLFKDIVLVFFGSKDEYKLHNSSNKFLFDSYLIRPITSSALMDTLINIWDSFFASSKNEQIGNLKSEFQRNLPKKLLGNILLVEDNLINQRVTTKLLENMGYQSTVVSSGIEALAILKIRKFDMIFMDCQMPEMDGFEVTRRIRQLENNKDSVPIIALTAHAMQGDKEKCLEAGMDDYLSKPIRLDELERMLTKWLVISRQQDRA
ncbi:MAG: response regulator [Candidatus Caenarcaniphilales bacterium]|nr:response regulator [Candidatus Caenarcaniphilales bacterium]